MCCLFLEYPYAHVPCCHFACTAICDEIYVHIYRPIQILCVLEIFETLKCPYKHIPCVESGHTAIYFCVLRECAHELQPISVYEPNGDRWRQRRLAQAKKESGKGAHHRKSNARAARKNALPTIGQGSSYNNGIKQSVIRCVNGYAGVCVAWLEIRPKPTRYLLWP